MRLDYRSVLFSICLIELLVACLAGIYALSARPRRRDLLLWALSYVMLLLGTLLVSLRGLVPDVIGVVLANLLLIGFLLFILAGLRSFRGRRSPWPWMAAAAAIIVAWMSYFSLARPDMLSRLVFYEVSIIALGSWAALEIGRKPGPGLKIVSRVIAVLLLAIAALNLARLILTLSFGVPADLLESGSWDAVMLVFNGAVAATLSIALILLHLSVLNEGLAAAARDRELLVREMAHRTKNDLSLVDSLVSIEQQSRAAADPAGSARLEALRDRIRCLSQAHDRLSHSEEPGMVMLEEYLKVIAEGLPRRDGVSVVIRFARVAAPFSYAAPLGLAMNELATNALKYAFPEGRGGTISLSLRAADPAGGRTLAELEVRDDGVGTRWPPEKPGLGTMIVQSFASKVDASIGYSFDGGSVFRLSFSLPSRSDRDRPPAPPAR
jgi:two-component sensor histidine kinase